MKKSTSLFLCSRATSLKILRVLLKSTCFSLFLFTGSQLAAQCGGIAKNSSIVSDLGTGPGLIAWTDPMNARTSDDVRTSAATTLAPGATAKTHYLNWRNFDFSIPGGASICGLVVAIEHRKKGSAGNPTIKDCNVELTNGSFSSSNYAKLTAWADTDEVFAYGSETDTWGINWTPSDVNQTTFGLNFAALLSAGTSSVGMAAEVDNAYIILYTNAVLPVELTSFAAKKTASSKVQLDWSTATETNNSFFIIQRSKDASTFTDLVHVKGAGSSLTAHSYSVIDPQPFFGTSYYRLVQVDMNGHEKVYPIASVYVGAQWNVEPVSQEGMILVHAPENMAWTQVDLISLSGEKMYTVQKDRDENRTEIRIDVTNVPSGLYFLKAVSDENQYCTKTLLIKE